MDSGESYANFRYKQIVEEQVTIAYMSKGAISFTELDSLSPYDRDLVLKNIIKIKEEEKKQIEESMKD